ncbi:MAG: KH domain-containing protein [Acidimicrobiales bacterium]
MSEVVGEDVEGEDVEGEAAEFEDDEVADDAGNRLVGAIPRNVVDYIARQIVDEPDAVVVEADEGRGRIDLRLHVAPDDMGKIIGKRGRVAQAIRTVVRAAGAREGVEASVDIVD